jgi:hypothetical protein
MYVWRGSEFLIVFEMFHNLASCKKRSKADDSFFIVFVCSFVSIYFLR